MLSNRLSALLHLNELYVKFDFGYKYVSLTLMKWQLVGFSAMQYQMFLKGEVTDLVLSKKLSILTQKIVSKLSEI